MEAAQKKIQVDDKRHVKGKSSKMLDGHYVEVAGNHDS